MAANFRGMWKPQKKPLSKMDREEVVKELRSFRNAWEKITTRDQDLSNERLKEESLTDLRKLLKFYYTEDAKTLAKKWLKMGILVKKFVYTCVYKFNYKVSKVHKVSKVTKLLKTS
jgi:hypothetical protein